ncbi:MAG: hypothetical protein ACI37Q_03490 [Candidatus Gastranaerophilaceae bacterium]
MKINEVIKKYKLEPLCLTEPQKEYVFTCVADVGLRLKKDFLYLPFSVRYDEIPKNILKVMQNPFCKGLVLNTKWYSDTNIKSQIQSLLHKFEVLAIAPNVYNLGYDMARDNSERYKVKTITVAGTDETSTVKEILQTSLTNSGYKVSAPEIEWSYWQKSIEPLLSIDETTDYAIIEAIPKNKHLTEYVALYCKNTIIYTHASLIAMNVWNEISDLSEELLKLLNRPALVEGVYVCDDNELIVNGIFYDYQDRLYLIPNSSDYKFKQDFYYLGRCYNLASAYLKNNNIQIVKAEDFVEQDVLYYEKSCNNCKFFILNKEKLSVNSLKNAVLTFANKYKDFQKILIYEHIIGLGEYKDNVYRDLFSCFAKISLDVLILLETKKFKHYFKRYNRQTYLKYFPFKSNDASMKKNIKIFFDGICEENCAVFVSSEHDLSFIWETDANEI